MNNLCADIGYRSVNHYGEELWFPRKLPDGTDRSY